MRVRLKTLLFSAVVALLQFANADAESVQLPPIADATLIEEPAGLLANGSGPGLYAGRTFQDSGAIRRALLRFDVSAAIPAGAIIQSTQLTFSMSKTRAGAIAFELHRALTPWTEGPTGGAGTGGASQAGDATWLHASFPDQLWTTPGGDYAAAPSATALVDSFGFYQWGPTADLSADVQSWLDNPASNHGWMLQGDESESPSTKQFESRQGFFPAQRPVLSITYTLPPCEAADVNCDQTTDGRDIAAFVDNQIGQAGCSACAGDMNGDADIDANDIEPFVTALLVN